MQALTEPVMSVFEQVFSGLQMFSAQAGVIRCGLQLTGPLAAAYVPPAEQAWEGPTSAARRGWATTGGLLVGGQKTA